MRNPRLLVHTCAQLLPTVLVLVLLLRCNNIFVYISRLLKLFRLIPLKVEL